VRGAATLVGAGALLAAVGGVAAVALGGSPAHRAEGGIQATRSPGEAAARSRSPEPRAAATTQADIAYDGRYTFVRIEYDAGGGSLRGFGGRERGFGGRREPPWAHDYPRAETNFAKIVRETTFIEPFMDGSRILRMDDPEVFKYPIAYVVEVGFWDASPREIEALGQYLGKGGFLIVDDFRAEQLYRLEEILQRAVPGMRILEVPNDHDIFDSFFHIPDPHALLPPTFQQYRPIYLGLFQDNDPSKRLMAILNYNNDIGEYWEFSDQGYVPIDLSNEAYKFGVNYVIYALTH
jgi:hypothetical protein